MLAGVGATVVCADVNLERATETADKILADGGKATSVGCDASSRADVEDLVLGAVAAHGRLDVMGNIAGIIHESAVVDTEEADLDRVLRRTSRACSSGANRQRG
jgi:3-oxoacyl-[acyl-carrier protein] reductase